jgi:hypothetical protein
MVGRSNAPRCKTLPEVGRNRAVTRSPILTLTNLQPAEPPARKRNKLRFLNKKCSRFFA